jgi:hypothetical protein
MEPIPGFPLQNGKVLKLKRSLYGLKQAGCAWNEEFHRLAVKIGFKQSAKEPCLYTAPSHFTKHASTVVLVVYVNNIALGAYSKADIDFFADALCSRFKASAPELLTWMLGISIQQTTGVVVNQLCICLSQKAYIEGLARRYGFTRAKQSPRLTPLPATDDKLAPRNIAVNGHASPTLRHKYASILGSLNWLALGTCPDIAYAISTLARSMQEPTDMHLQRLKGVLRYVIGTPELGIEYGTSNTIETTNHHFDVYADSDFAADKEQARSTSGYISFYAGGPVSWKSKLQSLTALSSTEAEYIALCEAAREGFFLHELVQDIHAWSDMVVLYTDNESAAKLVANPAYHSCTKHIAVRYHFVRQLV